VLLAMTVFRPALFAVSNDEEFARVSGLPVRTLNLLMAVTTAVTVTIAMRTVGLLLVSALMVVPVAAAQQVTRGFRTTMVAAMAIGLVSSALGVVVSAEADTAPGATTVILALAAFVAITAGGTVRRILRRRAHPPREVEPPDVVLQA
jgi:zinc transport system permease protein